MLDPLNITITGRVRLGDLPNLTKEQIVFGFVPNASALRAGDLILIQAIEPNTPQRGIAGAQQPQYQSPMTTQGWTHAAIYIRDWRVIEATPGDNVAHGNMLTWVPGYRMLVRRPQLFAEKPPAEAEMLGMSLALEAALQLGVARYGFWAALLVGLRIKTPALRVSHKYGEMQANSIICSGLYAKCFQIATQGSSLLTNAMQRNDEPVTPLLLWKISTLVDVPVGWSRLMP